MRHRHLAHEKFTLAAIDDVMARGRMRDWLELREATTKDPRLLQKILRLCEPQLIDPYAQRYYFWKHYAESRLARLGTRP